MVQVNTWPVIPKSETSPILATAVGLLMNALEEQEKDFESVPSDESEITDDTIAESNSDVFESNPMSSKRKSILDRWVRSLKNF